MLVLPDDIKIFSVKEQCSVTAQVVRLTRSLAKTKIDGTWWKIPLSSNIKEEEDHHWVWRKSVGQHRNNLKWEAVAVQSSGGDVEGAILYRIDAKSQIAEGEGAVFVDLLATAPRNRPWVVSSPDYRGVGAVLLLVAVRQSYLLGLGGRVWLNSLPSERTRKFYRKQGFQVIFENDDGTIGYELPSNRAEQWLKNEGYLR